MSERPFCCILQHDTEPQDHAKADDTNGIIPFSGADLVLINQLHYMHCSILQY